MPHQQPMQEVHGYGMPGVKNSLQHWRTVPAFVVGAGLGFAPGGTQGVAGPPESDPWGNL